MKFSQATIVAFAALLKVSKADFDIYWSKVGGNGISPNMDSWNIVDSDADCDALGDATMWRGSDDVSGDKWGVRCKGKCATDADPEDIKEIELNLNYDDHHWSKSNGGRPSRSCIQN